MQSRVQGLQAAVFCILFQWRDSIRSSGGCNDLAKNVQSRAA